MNQRSATTMSRMGATALALCLTLALSACGGGSSDSGPSVTYVHWNNYGTSLFRAPAVGGGTAGQLVGLEPNAGAVASHGPSGKIFFDRDVAGTTWIATANSDGSGATNLIQIGVGDDVGGIAIDPTNLKLYWTNFSAGQVGRANLDGTGVEPAIAPGLIGSPEGIAVDPLNGRIYVITYNQTQILRGNLDGTGLAPITGLLGGQGIGMAVDGAGGKIYYSLRDDTVYVADLDGAMAAPLVSGEVSVTGVALDVAGGKIYWGNGSTSKIRRANLAGGTGAEDIASTASTVWHVCYPSHP